MKYQTWYYFRKEKSLLNDTDNEIFSDNDSKITMIKKVMWRQIMLLTPFLLFTPIFMVAFVEFFNEDIIFKMIWSIYTLIMLFIISIYVHNVIKLNKLIQNLSNPLDS